MVKLQQLEIKSFGALSNKLVSFSPDLTVILGPNEAGKSTLFFALDHVLLTPSNLTETEKKRRLVSFFPAGGGDSIHASLRFTHAGGDYALMRQWGNNPLSELTLPDGSLVSEDGKIEKLMGELLPATQATMRSVFLTRQSSLPGTLQNLRDDTDSLNSLFDILRRAVLETDGISVENFRRGLEREVKEHYLRWDRQRERPEADRGIDRPWKKGTGHVLNLWYQREQLSRDIDGAETLESHLSVCLYKMNELSKRLSASREFVSTHRQTKIAFEQRGRIQAEVDVCTRDQQILRSDYDRWPELQRRVDQIVADSAALTQEIGTKGEQLNLAKAREEQEGKLRRLTRIRERKSQLDAAEERLGKTEKVTSQQVEKLKSLEREIATLRRELLAGRLSTSLTASAALELELQSGLDNPEKQIFTPGETKEFVSDGEVHIKHSDWQIDIQVGEKNRTNLSDRFTLCQETLQDLLTQLGITAIPEAEERSGQYEAALRDVEHHRKVLEEDLGDDLLPELEAGVLELELQEDIKPIAEIVKELTEAELEKKLLGEELAGVQGNLALLEETYSDRDTLFDSLAEGRIKLKRLEKELEQCAELPSDYSDWDAFAQAYTQAEYEATDLQREIHDLELERARTEASLPDESAEEMKVRLEEVSSRLEETKRSAETKQRILTQAEEILEGSGTFVTEEFRTAFQGIMSELTEGRYTEAIQENTMPEGLYRKDGVAVPYNLLSAGTKDLFSLALRLSMIRFFLGKGDGFVLMDDPMVDMDPERQRLTASYLKRFSETTQLILFTCHPSHAEYFDAKKILSF